MSPLLSSVLGALVATVICCGLHVWRTWNLKHDLIDAEDKLNEAILAGVRVADSFVDLEKQNAGLRQVGRQLQERLNEPVVGLSSSLFISLDAGQISSLGFNPVVYNYESYGAAVMEAYKLLKNHGHVEEVFVEEGASIEELESQIEGFKDGLGATEYFHITRCFNRFGQDAPISPKITTS